MSGPGQSQDETLCVQARREIVPDRASDQSADKPAEALPVPRLRHLRCYAARNARRDRPAARIPRAAPQIPGVQAPGRLPGRIPSRRHALAGSEPAPALGLFREPKALALPVHLLDGTLGRLVHRNIFNMASYLTKKLNTKPLPKLHRSGIPALLFWTSRARWLSFRLRGITGLSKLRRSGLPAKKAAL